MSTDDYIPQAKELGFYPQPPPLNIGPPQKWVLEIGPGNGSFLLHLAQQQLKTYFVAIELKRSRFEKICRHIDRLKLNNVFVIYGDARECLPRIFPNDFFEEIIVLFPDPWPKKRHAKHRLLKPRLIQQLQDLLKPGGHVLNATDAGFYSEEIVAAFQEVGGFQQEATMSPFPTYFEQKWLNDGRSIDYWRFVKKE